MPQPQRQQTGSRTRRTRGSDFATIGDVLGEWARKNGIHLPPRCETCRNTGMLYERRIGAVPTYCACEWGAKQRTRDARERAEMVETIKANRRDAMTRKLVLPAKHAAYTLESHPLQHDSRGRVAYQDVLDWLAGWDWRRGLVLTGAYGVGKTGLIVGVMKALIERAVTEGWDMRFTTALNLVLQLQAGFTDDSYLQTLEEYSRVHLLALDDLGAERVTDWRQDQFLTILNARYNAQLPLLATTNCSKAQLKDRLTERVYWRLYETCIFVQVDGANLREGEA